MLSLVVPSKRLQLVSKRTEKYLFLYAQSSALCEIKLEFTFLDPVTVGTKQFGNQLK